MKKRINLLTKQIEYRGLEAFFQALRIYILVFFGIFIVAFSLVFFFLYKQSVANRKLQIEKADLLQYLVSQKEAEAKFVYFNSKYSQIKNYLKNDVNFEPYYKLLNDSLKLASPEPELENLKIDKKKAFSFDLNFSNMENLLVFLKFAESKKFINNFEKLTLIGFSIDQKTKQKASSYQLLFEGTFKEIL